MAKGKVLITLDGSDFSRQIISEVCKFFGPDQIEIVLLQVGGVQHGHTGRPSRPASAEVPVPMYETAQDVEYMQHPVYASQEYDSAAGVLHDGLRADQEALERDGYTVRSIAKFGDPAREIVATANEEGVSLVAMTTHGRSGLSRLVSGSVAEAVLRNTSIPVFMLRPVEQSVLLDYFSSAVMSGGHVVRG
jgi:nucleotide-binding universal stress UspA family protein